MAQPATRGHLRAADIGVQTVRQARMDPTATGYRSPPENWEPAIAKLARERAAELVKLAEELEGRVNEATERERLAYHEAGHAVIAWTFGLEFKRVTIVPTEEWSGAVQVHTEGLGEFDEEVLRALAIATLAGEVAVEILTKTAIDWGDWLGVSGSDVEGYEDLALRLGWYEMDGNVSDLRPALEDREADVRSLLEDRWAVVEALAAALLRDDEVSETDSLRIMSEAGVPGPVASVWADLLEERRIEAEMRKRLEGASGKPIEIPREEWEG